MATLNISLPDAMRDYVDEQVASGRYATGSDFIRDLIRDRQQAHQELLALLAEAEASGDSGQTFDEIVAEARRDYGSRWH